MGKRLSIPFNSPIEIGLRSTSILCDGYPQKFSLQQLVYFDYLTIHSDDVDDGPPGLHPKTPHRSGELLIRRKTLEQGLMLYMSRGLIERHFENGIQYSASEKTASFLDSLITDYVALLRMRSMWVINSFGGMAELDMGDYINRHLGEWGAEFEQESVLWWGEQL
jgi:hypothetical protein